MSVIVHGRSVNPEAPTEIAIGNQYMYSCTRYREDRYRYSCTYQAQISPTGVGRLPGAALVRAGPPLRSVVRAQHIVAHPWDVE